MRSRPTSRLFAPRWPSAVSSRSKTIPETEPATPRKLSPVAKAALVREILVAYGRARISLARRGLPPTLARLRGDAPQDRDPGRPDAYIEGVRLGHAVSRVLRPMPLESRCLLRSLVLTSLLARRGITSKLVIGVRPGSRFGAHAWIESGGRPLLPAAQNEFERLVDL